MRNPIVRTKLWSVLQQNFSSSGASSASITQIYMNATNFPELTSWDNVYDSMRVLGGTLHYRPLVQTSAATTTSTTHWVSAAAVEFDELTVTPASPAQVLSSTYNSGPHVIQAAYVNGNAGGLADDHFYKLHFKVPEPMAPVINLSSLTASDAAIGKSWFPLQALGSNPFILSVVSYFQLIGTTLSSLTEHAYFLELDVEFRTRT